MGQKESVNAESVRIIIEKIIEDHVNMGRQALSSRCVDDSIAELGLDASLVRAIYDFTEDYIDANFKSTPMGRCFPGRLRDEGHIEQIESYVLSRLNTPVQQA